MLRVWGQFRLSRKNVLRVCGKTCICHPPDATFYTNLHVDAGRGRDLEAQFVPRKNNDVPLFMHKTDETDPGGD